MLGVYLMAVAKEGIGACEREKASTLAREEETP